MEDTDNYAFREHVTFIESVFLRPGMYTINGTVEEVGAFLQGFHSGMAAHTRNKHAQSEAQHWFDFCDWASTRTGRNEGGGWYSLFKGFRQRFTSDVEAFERLVHLYREFCEGGPAA